MLQVGPGTLRKQALRATCCYCWLNMEGRKQVYISASQRMLELRCGRDMGQFSEKEMSEAEGTAERG